MHMAEGTGTGGEDPLAQTTLPFRMAEMNLARPIPPQYPMADTLNTLRKEWMFHLKLLREEWRRERHRCCFRRHCAVPWFNFDRTLGRKRQIEWIGRHLGHQRFPILPNVGLHHLLGMVYLPSMDAVSHHASTPFPCCSCGMRCMGHKFSSIGPIQISRFPSTSRK